MRRTRFERALREIHGEDLEFVAAPRPAGIVYAMPKRRAGGWVWWIVAAIGIVAVMFGAAVLAFAVSVFTG